MIGSGIDSALAAMSSDLMLHVVCGSLKLLDRGTDCCSPVARAFFADLSQIQADASEFAQVLTPARC